VVSVIILARSRCELTARCLRSCAVTEGKRIEVMVVDNGSDPETQQALAESAAFLRERGIDCRVLRNETNIGCSTARNQGMDAARGEWIAFLDNDTRIVDPGWAAKLIAVFAEESDVGIVAPKMIYPPPGRTIQCAGAGVAKSGRVCFYGRGESADAPAYNERREVQWAISACMLFPKSLTEKIGGLDEAFNPVQYEDTDFCYRARSRGYRVVYEPGVEVVHDESATTFGGTGSTNAYNVIKHGMLFKKRWRHMFEQEDGPSEAETQWRRLGRWADARG
jgi:GT2 family glycosyltransferase